MGISPQIPQRCPKLWLENPPWKTSMIFPAINLHWKRASIPKFQVDMLKGGLFSRL